MPILLKNLTSAELHEALAPLGVSLRLARRYSDARAAALADLAKAKARLETARREVEEMILGTRKVQP